MNIIIGFIGLCAAALLIYYVYILMKGVVCHAKRKKWETTE